MSPEFHRRLAVVMAADVVGYSRLMGEDETGTLSALKAHLDQVIEPRIAAHEGRVIKLMGDGVLAEFASAVEAVACAVEIQEDLAERNAEVPESRRLLLRIGINLGDIIVDGDDLFGDGINIAARLEGLAAPGGICLARTVYEQVRNKVAVGFRDLGEHEVKNIAEPIHVFSVLLGGEETPVPERAKRRHKVTLGQLAGTVFVLLLLLGGAVAFWLEPWRPREEPASMERMAFPLPDKPSIAVLPFDNLSGDPEQDYFADGMSEDLITDLSNISGLFVIARNSSFSYKGKQVKVRQVAEELGVRYVLEGSVRRAGDQVRINAQLIDATTGGHVWADRFDRDLGDIFALQDEVVASIVSALAVQLTAEEKAEREAHQPTANLEAHEYYLRGKQHLGRFTSKDSAKAREFFEKAIELDPRHVAALTALGRLHYNEWEIWGRARDKNLARALELGQQAVAVDDSLAGPHLLLSQVYRFLRRQEESDAEADKALALEPRDADTLAGLGDMLRWTGRPQEAIGLLQAAMRLDPFYPAWYEFYLGHVFYQTGQYEEAIAALKRGAERNPNYPAFHLFMAASYAMLGREEAARGAADEVLRINPRFTLSAYAAHVPYRREADLERELNSFRKAGLPE